MRNRAFAFAAAVLPVLALSSSACGPVAKMNDFAEQMCACKDEACTDKVADAYDSFVKSNPEFRGNARQEADFTNAMKRFLQCRANMLNPGQGDVPLPQ